LRQKQRCGKEKADSKESFRWPREIEGQGIRLQGPVGLTLLAEESEAEVVS